MKDKDEIKELRKRNAALQNSAKEVMSVTRCRFCPMRFIRWLRRVIWKENK